MPSRIVFCRLGGIGDVIQTLPLVKYIKNKYPSASIEYVTSPQIAELLSKNCDFIDKAWVYSRDAKKQFCFDLLKDNLKIDYFFNFHSSLTFYFLNLFFLKAKKFYQYRKDNQFHAVMNFARTYSKNISSDELDSNVLTGGGCSGILSKYGLEENKYVCFVIGVGNVRMHRAWRFDNWLALTKKFLLSQSNSKVVLLGGDAERKVVDNWVKLSSLLPSSDYENSLGELIPELKNRLVDLVGKLKLTDTANVISQASKLVSGDTGLVHIATGLSKEVIGLYGPTLPKRTGPYGSSVQTILANDCACASSFVELKHCKETKLPTGFCMDSISVDNVLSSLRIETAKSTA